MTRLKYILYLISFLGVQVASFTAAWSQSPTLDTLEGFYERANSSNERVVRGIPLLDEYYYSGYLTHGVNFGKSLLKLIDSTQQHQEHAQIHNRLGTIYTTMGSQERLALFHLTKALSISQSIPWTFGIATACNNLGNIYRDWGYFTKAHEYYTASLTNYESINDSVSMAYVYKNLGILCEDRNWEEKSLRYHFTAYDIRRKIGNDREILSSLVNIGTAYNKFKKFKESLPYLRQADSLANLLQSEMQTEVKLELGDSYSGIRDTANAMLEYDKALQLALRYKKSRAIANILVQKTEVALGEGNYNMVTQLLATLLHHLDTARYANARINYYRLSYQLNSIQGNELRALQAFRKMTLLQDSLENLSNEEELLIRQNTFDLVQKDTLIQIEKEKHQFQRQLFYSILAFLSVLMAGAAYMIYQKIKTSRKLQEKQDLILERNLELKEKNEELATLLDNLRESEIVIQHQNQEIKKYNQQLIGQVNDRTTEIIEKSTQIAQFAYLVSHNMRGPVARIMGLRNILLLDNSKQEVNQMLTMLNTSIAELDEILHDISNIFDSTAGIREKIERIETETLVKDVLETLEREIKFSQAEVNYTITNTTFFYSSLHYITNILVQLILNAIKFRDETKTTKIDFTITSTGLEHIFTITDNGLGVDLVKHGNDLFTPYKRFHTHRTGRGFNLFLTKYRVEILGGTIRFESEVDTFTRVTVAIPRSKLAHV